MVHPLARDKDFSLLYDFCIDSFNKYSGLVMISMLTCVLLLVVYNSVTIFGTSAALRDSQTIQSFGDINVQSKIVTGKRTFRIHWYNPPRYIKDHRKYAMSCGFETCRYSNCKMSYDRTDANRSHAVIFDGRFMPPNLNFTRPDGQIWIFAAHEAPIHYYKGGDWWYKNKQYTFNWTMTYNKDNTDIFLPYGEILKHKNEIKRNFKSLALSKNKTLLIITSRCQTDSKRMEYVEELKKYVDVDVLGRCGKKWNCGIPHIHDDCFQILNTSYKFYLAFENSICHQYFTEKFYENFNYDLIMLVRGGYKEEAKTLFPYIATADFKSIEDLGTYLKNLSVDEYAELLKRKSQFYSPSYSKVYQRALCDICERMNNQNKYSKTIENIKEWAFRSQPCLQRENVTDV
ncbi:glycoprotein 3-alpha-L-fucosyltransferase A-like [Mercenaria mercenaria]|uniref:glycoprotein 3-alpha-L-fucosyltransferase A-like n=1 Tax=Mercenaria mercenaria TaxID=6596 RepID=UPI00234F008C|nr:glycoprotein 3-alpha-L-fucosyltransferase A-like [Mercenaria mercenaria]